MPAVTVQDLTVLDRVRARVWATSRDRSVR